jgi:Zn-dependent peptidase ImmA (M78 family)/transcriptional regulator with XRE-family HTH domain
MLKESELRAKLKGLRVKNGLTEADVAARLGKSGNSYINRIENGPTKINVEILDELCSFYKISPIELFRGEPDEHVPLPPPQRGFFERSVFRGVALLEEDRRAQIRDLLPTLRKIGRVQELLEKKPIQLEEISSDFQALNLKSPFAAQSGARKAAAQVRKFFKIDENSPLDVVRFCWNYLNIPICGLDLGPDCWGLHSSDKYGNPLIIYSTAHKFVQRNVFTIAHEIGHYLFAHDYLSVDCDNTENSIIEKVADTFAQELLVPSSALRQAYDELGLSLIPEIKPQHVVALCEYFKVSFFMMLVCLSQTKKLSFKRYNWLKDFCISRLEAESETLGYHPENYFSPVKSLKHQLRELVLIALRKEVIGFFEAAQMLDEPESNLKAAI